MVSYCKTTPTVTTMSIGNMFTQPLSTFFQTRKPSISPGVLGNLVNSAVACGDCDIPFQYRINTTFTPLPLLYHSTTTSSLCYHIGAVRHYLYVHLDNTSLRIDYSGHNTDHSGRNTTTVFNILMDALSRRTHR